MSNETKNNCCADGRHVSIQQAYKKEPGEDKRKPVSFTTPIQAVYDGKTGASLEAILAQFNSIYVQYQGSPQATRNIIPLVMRRAGLTITYMDMESNTITERASSAVQKDNDHWGLDVNWSRVDELSLSGDISVSANGTWIINGEDTGVKALGPKGDTGITPWLKTIDNKLHFSYDNVTWEPCSENIAAWFRFSASSSDSQAGTIGRIQISRDNKTWTDLSPEFRNYLRIQGYVATTSALPKSQAVGTIYGVGPTYTTEDTEHANPIYRLHVWNGTSWVDNGQFTSIAAGVVQETGDSETEVMSQKAVTEKLSELGSFFVNKGKYIHQNGNIYDTENESAITNYLPLDGVESITIKGRTNSAAALYAFFDKDKKFISSFYGEAYNNVPVTILSKDFPEDAIYFIGSGINNTESYLYGFSISLLVSNNEHINTIVALHDKLINSKYYTYNLSDRAESGYWNGNNNQFQESTSLLTVTTKISIGDLLETNSVQNSTEAVPWGFLDSQNNIIKRIDKFTTKIITQEDIELGAVKIFVPYRTTTQTESFYFIKKTTNESKTNSNNKKVLLFGDSQIGQCRMETHLETMMNTNVYNLGFGGCCWAWRTSDGSSKWDAYTMVEVVDALTTKDFTKMDSFISDSDIPSYFATNVQTLKELELGDGSGYVATIAYGGNDYAQKISYGNEDDIDKTTLYGAINYVVSKLLSYFPALTILIISPTYRVYEKNDDGSIKQDSDEYAITIDGAKCTRYEYGDKILNHASQVLHLPTFDMYRRGGRNKYNIFTICPDGVHPTSALGTQLTAEKYKKILKSF